MKIVFFGSSEFSFKPLEELIKNQFNIIAVYSKPPKQSGRKLHLSKTIIHEYAEQNNIDVFTPYSFKNDDEYEKLRSLKADIGVVVSYGLILPKRVLELFPFGCINIHPSLLPRWRGAAPLQRSIEAGDEKTAVCIMQMDEGMDTGDILIKKDTTINDQITCGKLHDDLSNVGASLIVQYLNNPKDYQPIRQSDIGITHAAKISNDDLLINFDCDPRLVVRKINAFSPKPAAYFVHNGDNIKITKANYAYAAHDYKIGEILIEGKKMSIACKGGYVYPLLLQRPSKKELSVSDFVNGFKI
jgi:methionyl-tRNA formyltransferase